MHSRLAVILAAKSGIGSPVLQVLLAAAAFFQNRLERNGLFFHVDTHSTQEPSFDDSTSDAAKVTLVGSHASLVSIAVDSGVLGG